jgi:hypothetical protein
MIAPPFDFTPKDLTPLLQQMIDIKANRWPGAVQQGFQGVNAAVSGITERDRQKQLIQKLAMAMQNYNQPQQGPQMPTGPAIQGPQGYVPPNQGPNSSAIPSGQYPMPQNPSSGMGAPTGQKSSEIIGLLMQMDPHGELVQKLIAQRMGLNQPPPLNPLQQSQMGLNQAKTDLLRRGIDKPGLNQGGWRAIQGRDGSAYLYNESNGEVRPIKGPMAPPPPKPVNPVPAAALDVKTQQINASGAPWYKKLLGQTPPIVNPLSQKGTQGVPQQGQTFNGKKIVSVEQIQ